MQRLMMLCSALVFAFVAFGFFAPAEASGELDQLRASGEVIERFDGYVEAAAGASSQAKALVKEVNAKRKAVYEQRAAQNNVPASEVGKVFAQEIFAQAPSGTLFKNADGSITKKP